MTPTPSGFVAASAVTGSATLVTNIMPDLSHNLMGEEPAGSVNHGRVPILEVSCSASTNISSRTTTVLSPLMVAGSMSVSSSDWTKCELTFKLSTPTLTVTLPAGVLTTRKPAHEHCDLV